MKKRRTSQIFAALLVSAGVVNGQVTPFEFIRTQTLRPSLHYKSWKFGDEGGLDRFTQFAFPISYSLPVSDRLAFDMVTSPFLSRMQPIEGASLKYDNLSDTFIRSSYILGDNLALLTLGAGLPSGNTDLSQEELILSGLSASRPLENPVTNFGTGLNLSLGAAVAQELGSWILGLGIGYSLRGKYHARFIQEEYEINPGDEFNLTLGIDRSFEMAGGNAKFITDFIYTNYTEDQLEGLPFFEAGDKFLLRAQVIAPITIFDPLIFTISNRWRLDNRSNNAALVDNGDELNLRATMFHPIKRTLSLKYVLDLKKYSNTVNDTEGADILGIGCGVVYNISRTLSFDPTFIFSKGRIRVDPETDIDVTAIEMSGGFSFRF